MPAAVIAHPEGFSGSHVKIETDRLRAAVTLHTRDLSQWFPPGKYPDFVADVCREMERTHGEIQEVELGEQLLEPESVKAFSPEVGLIEIDFEYALPPFNKDTELLVWSKHLVRMPRGHQQLLFVEDRRGVAAGEPGPLLLEDTLSTERDAAVTLVPVLRTDARSAGDAIAVASETSERTRPALRISFFLFGVEHIVKGYDHLLFLMALLLTCSRFKEAATIITCFTIAHSITLVLAALDIVRLPPEIVEPAIALSIVYVACENLTGKPSLGRRAAVTCAFGLVHGLGFASALREIGLGTIPGGVFLPLLKFNLGVEAGQLAIAAVVLPLLLAARRSERFEKRLVPIGSAAVALMGAYWLVTRIVEQFV